MKNTLKKFIIGVAILFIITLFVSITIFIIIVAKGGKVTENGIEQTGIIKINSNINDITVYVDGQKVNLKDKNIENLSKGEHNIKITKTGFTSWEKSVIVEEGIVKKIYVNLFPEKLSLKQVTNSNVDNVFFSPNGNYVFYVVKDSKNEKNNGIWKLKLTQNTFNLTENKPEKIRNLTDKLLKIFNNNYNIIISPDNKRYIISNEDTKLIFNSSNDNEIINLEDTSYFGDKIDSIFWFKNGKSVILQSSKSLFEFNIEQRNITYIHKFTQNAPTYAINGNILIFFSNSNYYLYQNQTRKILDTQMNLPTPQKIVLAEKNPDDFFIYDTDNNLHFLDFKNNKHITIGKYSILKISASGQNAIIKDMEGNLFVFTQEFLPAKDTLRTEINLIKANYNPNYDFITFSSYSNLILLKTHKKQNEIIYLYDIYGINNFKLLENQFIHDNSFALVDNNKKFYILLLDSTENENDKEKSNYNLYKIDLTK